MRPRLLLDCDGVLADFTGSCLDVLLELTGKKYDPEDVTHWDIMACLGITDDIKIAAYAEMSRPGFCRNLSVMPGAQSGVQRLQQFADVFIVTSPLNSPTWAWEREQWLKDNFGIPQGHVISTSAKFTVDGDIIVDDKTPTLVEWEKEQCGFAIQWKTPHNRLDGWVGISTGSWDELVGLVRGYSHGR